MRLSSWFRLTVSAGFAISLTACSLITDLFPDKQKQYRYSSELPELEIPPDLGVSKVADSKDTLPDKTDEPSVKVPKKRKPSKHSESSATLAQNSDNAALIEVSEPFPEAWNDVSRALGRLKIEVSDQNRADGVFYVYYGGESPKKAEEVGFFGKIGGLFGMGGEKAKEFRVKLEDKDNITIVRVHDQDDKGVSDGKGLELLKRLHKKLITLDQPEADDDKKDEDKEKPKSDKP